MEATIGIVPMIIIVLVMWKTGVFGTLRTAVDMANLEVEAQATSHKTSVLKRVAELEALDEATVQKAVSNVAALKSFKL